MYLVDSFMQRKEAVACDDLGWQLILDWGKSVENNSHGSLDRPGGYC